MSAQPHEETAEADEHDADAILAELEEEDDASYRNKRLQEIQKGIETSQPVGTNIQNPYHTLKGDDDALRFTTEHEQAVVHFFHPDFARCHTMDTHCQSIASQHNEYGDADVAFGKVDVNHAPFVVEKLGIRVLPCVIGFVKGVAKGRVTGFEGICWDGQETSQSVARALEEQLVEWGVVRRAFLQDNDGSDAEDGGSAREAKSGRRGISDRKHEVEDEEDDWD